MRGLGLLAMPLLWLLPVSVQAAVVSATTANCRAAARVTAPVLAKLPGGTIVEVLSRSGDWRYVDPPATAACWVAAQLLTDGGLSAAYAGTRTTRSAGAGVSGYRVPRTLGYTARRSPARYSAYRPRRASATRSRSRRSSGYGAYGSGGSCPCRGSSVCIGPRGGRSRGGRYCITSGGNKRYGV